MGTPPGRPSRLRPANRLVRSNMYLVGFHSTLDRMAETAAPAPGQIFQPRHAPASSTPTVRTPSSGIARTIAHSYALRCSDAFPNSTVEVGIARAIGRGFNSDTHRREIMHDVLHLFGPTEHSHVMDEDYVGW